MDAVLPSLEDKASERPAATREDAYQVLTHPRKMRDDFLNTVNLQAAINEARLGECEGAAREFQAELTNDVESFGQQNEPWQAIFRHQAGAQLNAWRDAAGNRGPR
ncbi:hypothetical protein [Rhizobium mesoamericanum]|uniref:hypothetical protein n=1 Tax=Rhizobium mesoamericanum TaxID=1079800 RepID=UPI00040448B0|nr:hypothetical protein [Rhizobium mesoamericanum]